KVFLSAGFWITLVLFVAVGYAFGADCPGTMNCGDGRRATASSATQYENRASENEARASDSVSRSRCNPRAALRSTDPTFPQVANWQRGGSMYAPGLSFTLTSKSRVTLCPGPVEIP